MLHKLSLVGIIKLIIIFLSIKIGISARDEYEVYPSYDYPYNTKPLGINWDDSLSIMQVGSKFVGFGACFYIGLGITRQMMRKFNRGLRSDDVIGMTYLDPLTTTNVTDQIQISVRKEIDELWNALLQMHKKQSDLIEDLQKNISDDKVKFNSLSQTASTITNVQAEQEKVRMLISEMQESIDKINKIDKTLPMLDLSNDPAFRKILDQIDLIKRKQEQDIQECKEAVSTMNSSIKSRLKEFIGQVKKMISELKLSR